MSYADGGHFNNLWSRTMRQLPPAEQRTMLRLHEMREHNRKVARVRQDISLYHRITYRRGDQ